MARLNQSGTAAVRSSEFTRATSVSRSTFVGELFLKYLLSARILTRGNCERTHDGRAVVDRRYSARTLQIALRGHYPNRAVGNVVEALLRDVFGRLGDRNVHSQPSHCRSGGESDVEMKHIDTEGCAFAPQRFAEDSAESLGRRIGGKRG